MNNEPVAWIFGAHLDSAKKMPHLCRVTPTQENENYIPLYTHPVKEQDESFDRTASHMAGEYVSYKAELTDEEIWEVIDNCFGVHAFNLDYQIALDEAREDAFELVKAILRKASEK